MLIAIAATVIGGLSEHVVFLANHTGSTIARIQIDDKIYEAVGEHPDEILVHVTPETHHLKLVFRGGAKVDWPRFDFKGVKEIIFQRTKNKIDAYVE